MRKSTEQLMLEVHSRLNNAQVALMKQQVINELGEMSKEAVIEIIAKNIGCEMEVKEERTKMEGEKELKGSIEEKKQTEGMKGNKPWKRWTYKLGNSNLTLATFTDFPFNVGQNVKIIYKDNGEYHNIVSIEADAVDVVKQEMIEDNKVNVPYVPKAESVIKYDSMNLSYFSAKSGLSLTEQINDFGKSHNVKATQTHVYGSFDSNANPEAVFCAFVWWK